MKVQCILRETELKDAVAAYIKDQGYPVDGMDIQINLIKGRTASGTRAEVTLVPKSDSIEEDTFEENLETEVEEINVVELQHQAQLDKAKEEVENPYAHTLSTEDEEEETVTRDSLFS